MENVIDDMVECENCGESVKLNIVKDIDGDTYCPDCSDNFVTCQKCGDATIDIADAQPHQDVYYCNYCYDLVIADCEVCGETELIVDGIYEDDKFYCTQCHEEIYDRCYSCDTVTRRSEMCVSDIGDSYCNYCYDEVYTNCDMCGQETFREESYYSERDDQTYCSCCYDSCENNHCEYLHDYNYKPHLVYYGKSKFYLGIELECDNGNDFDIVEKLSENKELYFKEDGSLQCGFEMVSMPMTLKCHQDYKWSNILKNIRLSGFTSFDAGTCGLHIHVPKSLLTQSQQIKLAMLVYTNPEYFQKLAQRSKTIYAKYKKLNSMKETIKSTAYNNDRFEAINFQNSETIEFRMFKGTLKHTSFLACIELVHALISFVKAVKTSDICKKNMFKSDFRNGEAYRNFCIYVCNSKDYIFLKDYMKEKKAFVTL